MQKIKRSTILILLCWVAYTCSYVGKLGFSANIKSIENYFNVTHAQSGTVTSCFFFAYGIGQIVNGILCKRYNVRVVVALGLLLSGIMNLTVGIVKSFEIVKFLWLINGVALSFLWTSIIKTLSENLDKKEMGKAVVVIGTTVATGTFIVYGLSSLFVALGAFKIIFFLSGVLLPLIGLIWFVCIPKVTLKQEKHEEVEVKLNKNKSVFGDLGLTVAVIALFAVVNNFVKDGLTTWVPAILTETYNLPEYVSILLTLLLPILAFFGVTVAVKLRKKISNFVKLISFLFFTASIFIGIVASFLTTGGFAVTICCFSVVSCLMASVNNVITSMAPLYWKEKANSGFLAGFFNGFCYLGSTLSSFGLGYMADMYGWNVVIIVPFALCLVVSLFGLFPFKNAKSE